MLFGRLPEAGRTKTRLEPALGSEGAARLYRAFLDDCIARSPDNVELELWVPARPGARETLSESYPEVRVRLQPEGDLGERLRFAFDSAFEEGVDYATVAGTDHPTLPRDYIMRAFRALRSAHLVVGPADDGGYCAIGLRRYCWPAAEGLFEGAPWSRPDLLGWTRRRARELDLCHVELPDWYDVDGPEDLDRLRRDVDPGSRTAEVLAELLS